MCIPTHALAIFLIDFYVLQTNIVELINESTLLCQPYHVSLPPTLAGGGIIYYDSESRSLWHMLFNRPHCIHYVIIIEPTIVHTHAQLIQLQLHNATAFWCTPSTVDHVR